MCNRWFTHLAHGLPKKLKNQMHALSIYFMHYNFVRIYQTLRCKPVIEAGVTDRLWSVEELIEAAQ